MLEDTFLDVAIGLTFTFALLSVITTSLTEGCANLMRSRSRALGSWLEHMLGHKLVCDDLMANPMIRALCPPGRPLPDYIPAETFTMALLETLAPREKQGDAEVRKRPCEWTELEQMIATMDPKSPLRQVMSNVAVQGRGNLREVEHAIADWFDASMQRLSGWYARQAQLAAFAFASLLTISLNADALMIADALWQDDDVRAAVVEQASAEAGELAIEQTGTGEAGVEAAVTTLQRLDAFPLGWSSDALDPRRVPSDASSWSSKLMGFGLTVLAITLGAPFWFDLLSRFVGLRSAGRRPMTSAERRTQTASNEADE